VGPNNLWWKNYNIIAEYGKRMSWLMTDSVNVTSIAILCEEDHLPWKIAKPLYQNQIEFNYLEDNIVINEAVVSQSLIKIKKQQYDTLIIEDLHKLNSNLNKVLNRFSQAGGHVLLYNPKAEKHALKNVVEFENYTDVVQALREQGRQDVLVTPYSPDLRVSHVVKKGIDFYLFANEGEKSIQSKIYINNKGYFEKWDSWSGKIEELKVDKINMNSVIISMDVKRRESIIICVDKRHSAKLIGEKKKLWAETIDIKGPWILKRLVGKDLICEKLVSWTELEDMKFFSGEVIYETLVKLENVSLIKNLILDLGEVGEMAKIYINDKYAGIKMWAPFEFDIVKFVKFPEFKLKIEVINSISNKIVKTKVKSGLLGPVTLKKFFYK